ncbi:MAG: hypothetical protein US30_C0022G0002 [Candidatus Moranbacteria bacterium GW2011_GWF2_36_839]|nr:MAG: hypothetical protein US30_C0022G0002 [Candidatus Moranbacteria bacterium GW2011_GWF2_36_839]
MLKSSALIYAVFLMLIISIICGSAMMNNYFHHVYIDKAVEKQRVLTNLNSAVNLYLDVPKILEPGQQRIINLYDEENDQVTLSLKPWGMYCILTATSGWKNWEVSKSALIGDDILDDDPIALYLPDQNDYLSLCGNTVIKGTVSLSKLGTKRAYIEGKSFSGSKMIDGEIKISSRSLPEIDKRIIEAHKEMLKFQKPVRTDSVRLYEEFANRDTISNSFVKKTLILDCVTKILSDKVISGNIIIKSSIPVEIDNTLILDDIIVYAPSITIKKEFTGKAQFFVRDSLLMEEKCTLRYPSCVGLINDEKNNDKTPFLTIDKDCEISGCVFLYYDSRDFKKHGRIVINQDTRIFGQVYSNDLLQLSGEVYGSVYCNRFILKTASSIYENHLLDAVIDITKLPPEYVGVSLLEESNKKEVIKWLN